MRARLSAAKAITIMQRRASQSRTSESEDRETLEDNNAIDEYVNAKRFAEAVQDGDYPRCKQLLDRCTNGSERAMLANSMCASPPGSVLMTAILFEFPNIVRLLIMHGADPSFESESTPGATPLSLAIRCNRPFIISLVVEAYLTESFLSKGAFLSIRELEAHFSNEAEQQVARRALVELYASMSVEELCYGIPKAFQDAPALMLLDLVELSASTQRKAMRLKQLEPSAADDYFVASNRIQLAAAGCLRTLSNMKDALSRWQVDEILGTPRGLQAIRTALRFQCRVLLAQPEVQRFMTRLWQGTLLNGALGGHIEEVHLLHQTKCLAFFLLAALLCVACAPLFAALPCLESWIYERLAEAKYRGTHMHRTETRKKQRCSHGQMPDHATTSSPISKPASSFTESRSSSRRALSFITRSQPAPAHLPRLWLADGWLYRVPICKFAFSQIWCVAMAVVLTTVDVSVLGQSDRLFELSHGSRSQWPSLLLLWALGNCISEYIRIAPNRKRLAEELLSLFRRDVPSHYRTAFNALDFVTAHLMLAALALPSGRRYEATILWSGAAAAAWLRLLRLLALSHSLGPLTLMFIRMLTDVTQLLIIELFVFLAMGAAVYVLFRSADRGNDADNLEVLRAVASDPLDSCNSELTFQGELPYRSFEALFFAFANGAIDGDGYTACLMREHKDMWALAWLYAWLFKIVTAVLLLNMLIAMMSKTFDSIWEASAMNHKFLFTRLVFNQLHRQFEPPPLNLLRIPLVFVDGLIHAFLRFIPRSALTAFLTRISAVLGKGLFTGYSVLDAEHFDDSLDSSGRFVGITVEGRNSWEAWKAASSEEAFREKLEAFVAHHADDVAQEDRWRSKMMRRVAVRFDSLSQQIADQQRLFEASLTPNAQPSLVGRPKQSLGHRGGLQRQASGCARIVGRRQGWIDPALPATRPSPMVRQKSRPSRIVSRNKRESAASGATGAAVDLDVDGELFDQPDSLDEYRALELDDNYRPRSGRRRDLHA